MLLSPGIANAQTYNNGYLLGKPAAVFRGLHLVNDTLIAHGYVAETFAFNPVKYIIAKIELDGTPLIAYSAILDSFTDYFTASRFVITNDSCYAFVGVKNNFKGGLFFKLKQNGAIEFAKEYIDTTAWGYGFTGVLQLPDSSFVIMGLRTGTTQNYYISVVIKTDPQGNQLWREQYFNEMPTGITHLNSDHILLSSYTGLFTGPNAFFNTVFRTIDTSGHLLATWVDTSKKTFGANAYLQLNDGGGIYVSEWINDIYTSAGNPPTYLSMRCGYIVREDSTHHKIWELKLGQASAIPNLFQLKKLSDGHYLAAGGTYDSTYTDGQPYKNTGWLIKFDENGQVIWQRKYFNTEDYPGQTNYLYDLVELADGSIVAAGERIDEFNDYPQRGWLLRLDSYGCLVPGCQLVGLDESTSEKMYLSIYPIPVSDQLYIHFNSPKVEGKYSLKIYTTDSKEVYNMANLVNNSTYVLNTHLFPKGVLIVQLFDERKLVSSQKIVKL
ncbi:MAG: T9SS type A sorting domain-containing protein [Chitinophagales bacterium]|nr:T9SS type A sorting domain-containing protein [Chitinophagales bacterium]